MIQIDQILPPVARTIEWAFKIRTDKEVQIAGVTRLAMRDLVRAVAPGLGKLLLSHMNGEWLHLNPPPWTPFEEVVMPPLDPAVLAKYPEYADLRREETVYLNSRYQVNAREVGGGMTHLSIKRVGKEPHIDWRDMQRIKTELTSATREGMELYPAESRVVDTANQYHIWVLPEGAPLGFGLGQERIIMNNADLEATPAGGGIQRPFET